MLIDIMPNSLLDRGIAITIILFILSLISERIITFCKLYFTEGKALFLLIAKEDDLSTKSDDEDEEKEREMKILKVNIAFSITIAILAKANLFAIISANPPYQALGWHSLSGSDSPTFFHYIQILFGCILGGFFISLGSKFWHDMLDMLLQAKNLKQKLGDKATYDIDNSQQLDDWLKVTQGDVVKKVFDDNKEMLKNLKNVIGVGIRHDENNDKYLEVVTNDSDIHLIPKTLPYTLPSGAIKEVSIQVRVSSGIVTHLKLADDITNKDFPNEFGSCGLAVCYKNDPVKASMLLTCYHVVIGKKHSYDHFLFEGDEDIIHPHGDNGQKIGSIRFGLKNNEIDAALVTLENNTLSNTTPDGTKISSVREIKYEEQYSKVNVKMYGFNNNQAVQQGKVCSKYNDISIKYNLPDGSTQQMALNNLIATANNQNKALSQPGDSGSVVLDENNSVIGIIVAGDTDVSYIIPIQTIFNQLNIQLI